MIRKAIFLMIIFLLGMASSSIYAQLNTESPFGLNNSIEISTPNDRIKESQIKVYNDKVIIYLDSPQWATFTPTGSMEPVLNQNTHAIELIPKTEDEISVGDIVSYKSEYSDGVIIHRVVYIGNDEEGKYFILKGDNNPTSDPGRIRFSQIQRVVVGLIY